MIENNRWTRAVEKEPCMEIINTALGYPKVHVLAVGPESCLRTLYFRAMHENQNSKLHFIEVTAQEMAMASHLPYVEEVLNRILHNNAEIKGVLIYVSCGDLISGTYYDEMISCVGGRRGVSIKSFIRGPLTRRRTKPRDRLYDLLDEMQLEIEMSNNVKGSVL